MTEVSSPPDRPDVALPLVPLVPRATVPATPSLREALVRDALTRLHGIALALTGHAEDAEDLVQEAYLKAFRAAALPAEASARVAWLVTILRNSHTDRLRRRRVERGPRAEQAALARPRSSAEADDVADRAAEARRRLQALPDDERLVCWLRLVADVPFREIAELLSTSKSAVDRLFRRGLERLERENRP